MMQVLEVLKKCALFENCNSDALENIAKISKIRELSGGQALFFENEDSRSFFLLRSGTVAIKKTSEKGDVDIARIGSDSYLGELALLREKGASFPKRSASAEAVEPSVLAEIPYAEFERLLGQDPTMAGLFFKNLATQLAGRIRRTAQDLSSLKALRLRHL
jgi:CRP-like cAMP-binding protein